MVTVNAPIEVDITQVNKTWFTLKKKKDRGPAPQFAIGFYQRIKDSDNCRLTKLPAKTPSMIAKLVQEHVQPGATLYCEKGMLPDSLREIYVIEELNDGEHVRGDIHINNIKNAWKDLKRNIKREYISVSSWHLELYLGEVEWHVNHRNMSASERFETLIKASVRTVKHMTYDDLTDKNQNSKKKKSAEVSHQKLASEVSP